MRLVLLGTPGSGKGTQAGLLQQKYKVPHISTGELFRTAVKEKTEVGIKAAEYLKSGHLVPDDIVMGIVNIRLDKPDCATGFLFDGFPRTDPQAKALDGILDKKDIGLNRVVYLKVPTEQIVQRLSGRRTCKESGRTYNILLKPEDWENSDDKKAGYTLIQREDDAEEVVQERLQIYTNQTKPLIEYYDKQGLLATVKGVGTMQEVFDRIVQAI